MYVLLILHQNDEMNDRSDELENSITKKKVVDGERERHPVGIMSDGRRCVAIG